MPALNALTLAAKPDLNACEQRQASPDFRARAALTALAKRLPLPWPTPSGTPPSPKRRFRSAYQAPKPAGLSDPAALDAWALLGPFDLLLRLVDFSPLRPVLAAKLYQPSALGRVPFDPVSLFLLFGWQLVNRWNRLEVLGHLRETRYADYARVFGFGGAGGAGKGPFPSESGYRYFLTTLGGASLHDLLVQSMSLVRCVGLIPEPLERAATLSFDGQLHDAASRLRCPSVGEGCYQPTSADASRACPAREKGQVGCRCDTTACKSVCKRAAARDPAARYVWYQGHNRDAPPPCSPQSASSPESTPTSQGSEAQPQTARPGGEGRFGYRSLPAQLVDPIWRLSWTLDEADLAPANRHEESCAGLLLRRVVGEYPWLHVGAAVGDAGLGYAPFLEAAYALDVRRVIDLRANPRTDHDRDGWAIRGYDDKGWAVCQFGCRLHPNGYDFERHRMKWCCRQACEAVESTHSADLSGPPAACPPDCPYRDRAAHPLGRIINVGKTFADGSLRLVRDVPYGSTTWKALYRRGRNAAEGRNARLEEWGLKRLPVFGQPRSQATIFLADLWANLLQLARLIKEATLAQASPQTRPA